MTTDPEAVAKWHEQAAIDYVVLFGQFHTEQQCAMVAEASGWRERALKAEKATAEHERMADRVAKLEEAVLGLLHSPDTATRAFARALLTPAEGVDDGR
jgi:hypothetical protein